MRRQHFSKGDLIFAAGDPSAYAYILEEGRVEIFRGDGTERFVLGELGIGEIFGEMGLVDERPRSASARVLEDATVAAITADEFVPLLFDDPDSGLRYLKALFERLRVMNDRADRQEIRPSQVQPAPVTNESDVRIFAATQRAGRDVPDDGHPVDRLPFRVGRKAGGVLSDNHLELDDRQPYNVSRNHFLIDVQDDAYVVRDRGSFLGTIVNGEKIGGRRHNGEAPLQPGDNVVIAGEPHSPWRFRIYVKA